MATVKGKDNVRYDRDLFGRVDNVKGRYFVQPDGSEWDSRSVSLVHVGVDTVKQLYTGLVKLDIFQFVEDAYNSGTYLIQFQGYTWKIGSARKGGYRYFLNNPDLGVLVLLGSFYTEPKYEGDHLKIELSPHFILSKGVSELQKCMDYFADFFIQLKNYSNVAFHICVDVQGFVPPSDFDSRLVTRASKIVKYSGQSEVAFEKHAIATVYGAGETFTFGGVGSLQFSAYNKTKLINKNDNVREYWHSAWGSRCLVDCEDFEPVPFGDDVPEYKSVFKKDVDVWRFESRVHHSVVAQFAQGISQDLRSFAQVSEHLTGIWRYSLGNFRFDSSATYIHPFWQFLRDDVIFNHDDNSLIYKRVYKKTDFETPPSERTLRIVFGLLCSCYRKLKYDFIQARDCLLDSGIYHALEASYLARNDWKDDYTWADAGEDILETLKLKLSPPLPLSFE